MVRHLQARRSVENVRAAKRGDRWFDAQLPARLRVQSSSHFTPVAIARRAARLLAPQPGMLVLDVGAGVGKFCVTAAREVETATFVGVEVRPHLVRIAAEIARREALSNVHFVTANAFDLDWAAFDSFYLFNPFAEQLFETTFVLDHTIKLEPQNFVAYVTAVRQRLARARVGTRVLTYHGFGAPPPPGYELTCAESMGTDRIALWTKTRSIFDAEDER